MRNPLIRLSGLAPAWLAVLFCHPLDSIAQTVADNGTPPREPAPVYAPTAGSATHTAALAKTFTVTREFNASADAATINVLKGTVNYQIYIRTHPDLPWKLVDTKTGIPAGTGGVQVHYPESYELKVMITADCRDCVDVRFGQ